MEFNLEVFVFSTSAGTVLWVKLFHLGFCVMMYCEYKTPHLDILCR